MRPIYVLIAGLIFTVPAWAMPPLPGCAGRVEMARARILRVEKNGVLILADGRTVMLEGVRLPLADGGPPSLARNALEQLAVLAKAGPWSVAAVNPAPEDRYGRLRAQLFGHTWIQAELLRRGLARVQIAPDRQECAAELYDAEKEARAAGRGLWAFANFAPRNADAVRVSDRGSFQIVEGTVMNAANHGGRVFLDFHQDYRSGFSAIIAPEDHRAFRKMRPRPEDLAGRIIRLRGLVQVYGGRPEIAISSPAQIELVQ